MTAGKAASQAGHAFLDSFVIAPPEIARAYLADGGTKIVLTVPDEQALCDLYHKARMAKLPCAMVVESNHIMPPSFDGSPIVTAIGIGPVAKAQAREITKGLRLMG
jgi:peptidyl-tRNA hydrolase